MRIESSFLYLHFEVVFELHVVGLELRDLEKGRRQRKARSHESPDFKTAIVEARASRVLALIGAALPLDRHVEEPDIVGASLFGGQRADEYERPIVAGYDVDAVAVAVFQSA